MTINQPRLNVSDVVNVTVDLTPRAAAYRNFGAALILGDSTVIDAGERMRVYADIDGVVQDFGVEAPEYKASLLHFSQSPRPSILYIGRWVSLDVSAELKGRLLTYAEQVVSNFTGITAGAFFIYLNGVPTYISGVNLSAETNLNGVASKIQDKLALAVPLTTVEWNATYRRFEIRNGVSGATSALTFAKPPTAFGNYTFTSNPAPLDKVTINAKDIVFVDASPGDFEVLIGDTKEDTAANLAAFVNTTSDVDIGKVTALASAAKVYTISVLTGTAGNAYTIAKTSSALTVSGATLSGGTGVDLSALVGWQLGGGTRIISGMAAETLPSGVSTLMDFSGDWYGLTIAATANISNASYIDVAQLIEASTTARIFGVTISDADVLDPISDLDLASSVKTLNLKRTWTQYSTSSPYAATAMFARASTVDFNANNSTITLKFKQEPGIAAEFLTETMARTLKAKNCNVFAAYQNLTAIIQEGVMANGYFFDEVHGTDWLQNKVQEDVWNLFYTSPTKIPQTDAGMHMIVTVISASMAAAVNNGLVAPGRWTGPDIGQLKYGNVMGIGYYVFAPPMADQAQADREQRKAPPIQVAAKLAGAIHFAGVIISCNR